MERGGRAAGETDKGVRKGRRFPGRARAWEGDLGLGLRERQAFRRKWRRGGEEEGEEGTGGGGTTPELPDQVIAVRCQECSRERRRGGTCAVRAVWGRESRQSE